MADLKPFGELGVGLDSLELGRFLGGAGSGNCVAEELSPKRHQALQSAKHLLNRDFDVITSVLGRHSSHLAEEHSVITLDGDGGGDRNWIADIDDQAFSLHLHQKAWETVLGGSV